MKKLVYLSVLLGALFFAKPSTAQINININIGNSLPAWGPSGYNSARYYYMPEYDLYYDVVAAKYVWWEKNNWQMRSKLPARLAHIDLYRTYKVVLNDRNPWNNHNSNHSKYYAYRDNRKQVTIKDYNNHVKGDYVAYNVKPNNVRDRANDRINAAPQANSNIRSANAPRR